MGTQNPSDWKDVPHCPLCQIGLERRSLFERINDGGAQLQYQLCDRCGLVFQSPRMNEAALDRFYVEQYRQMVQASEGPTEKDLRVQAGRARAMLRFIRRDVSAIGRHLDIGSSAGALLVEFRAKYACESVGIEPGDAYRNFTEHKGLRVYPDLESMESQDESSFDMVSMSHVLEHFPDPLTYLKHLRATWMASGGMLLIEVPNLFGHQAFEFSHLAAYSAATLKAMLEQAGFEVLRMRAHGQPRSRLIPLYLTALARSRNAVAPSGRIFSTGRGVRWRRRLGMIWRRLATKMFPRLAWLPWPSLDQRME